MGSSPLQRALEVLHRPLAFASRDDFAALARLRDLDTSVVQACRKLLELAIPRDLRAELEAIARGFAAASERNSQDEGARARVGDALARIEAWLGPAANEAALGRSVRELSGIGPKRAATLEQRGLGKVGDLLLHLPVRYDDRRSLERVADLEVGRHATFIAEVRSCDHSLTRVRGRLRKLLRAVVGDDSGDVGLKWFRAPDTLAATLQPGATLLVTGDIKRYRFDIEVVHPEIELIAPAPAAPAARSRAAKSGSAADAEVEAPPRALPDLDALRRVVPEYATPEGIPARTFRRWIASAVDEYADLLEGHLPDELVRERSLPEPSQALRLVHAPEADADVSALLRRNSSPYERLILEELYLLELGLALRREREQGLPGISLSAGSQAARLTRSSLPFELTNAQARAWSEIERDVSASHPMNRLLQGDVGSGKTAVAFLAAMTAIGSGHQVVFMAPTELLAEQHARTLERLAAGLPEERRPTIELLVSSRPRAEAAAVRTGLEAGDIDLVVGTHALVAGALRVPGLGLAIIDEQHRFGVRQRAALAALAASDAHAHVLVMTATPIPRTLALTLYGDLDVSVIDELPPGRAPTKTLLARAGEGKQVADLLRDSTARGEQVYVVYPLVEESEKTDLRAAAEQAERIRLAFPELSVDLVHGRVDAGERARTMARFERGETNVLVATTVIEVGVDVANATLMVIEHAERFGLAQLHQLRGRVGRGERPGTCVLVSRGGGKQAEARLSAMLETTDGFEIADADLRIRGPGEFLGTRQSGHLPDLRIADLVRDGRLVALAREAALESVRRDPQLRSQAPLRRAVELRWGDRLALAGVG